MLFDIWTRVCNLSSFYTCRKSLCYKKVVFSPLLGCVAPSPVRSTVGVTKQLHSKVDKRHHRHVLVNLHRCRQQKGVCGLQLYCGSLQFHRHPQLSRLPPPRMAIQLGSEASSMCIILFSPFLHSFPTRPFPGNGRRPSGRSRPGF